MSLEILRTGLQTTIQDLGRFGAAHLGISASGASDNLEDAYAKALRLDDNLYQQSLEAERTKVKSAEDKRRKEAVAKAKKVPTRRSSNPPAGSVQSSNLDDILGNAFINHSEFH